MASIFNNVQGLHPKRNAFSADTYRNDFTAPLGVNIPCYVQHVTAATRIKCSASALVRLQALIAPVMDNIDYYVHFWKIPYRLLENDRFTAFFTGEKPAEEYDALFITARNLAADVSSELENPVYDDYSESEKVAIFNRIFGNGSIMDFLGYDLSIFPTLSYSGGQVSLSGGNNTTKLNWRGFLAYYMLHVNWYMNENVPYFTHFVEAVDNFVKDQDEQSFAYLLVASVIMTSTKVSGSFTTYSSMLPHAWEKDYFTSALPNVQFGDPVTLPLAGSAPGVINPNASYLEITNMNIELFDSNGISGSPSNGNPLIIKGNKLIDSVYDEASQEYIEHPITSLSTNSSSSLDFTPNNFNAFDSDDESVAPILVNLGEASAISINELRFANALQVFKERQLRYGRRRLEYYKGFFDVSPEDLRMQVPKYLGGGRIPINISDIEQTSATSGTSALGHLAGKATAVAGGFAGFNTFCSEESVIIGIAFAMPHITYANGMSRFNLKTNDIYDYYNPSFQHLGEQAIKNIELYAGTDDPDGDFGYTPRYTEYRFHANEMHGEFKDTLAYWSLGRIFGSTPALNAKFIYMQPSVFDRIFAVSGQPNMIVSMLFHVKSIKPISKYGTPMLLA